MKTLLVFPPSSSTIKDVLGTTAPPLGLAYIASVLESEGEGVRVIDALAEGLNLDDVEKTIYALNPDLVGITSATATFYDGLKVARVAKKIGCKVVMSGPHVTFKDIETLQNYPYVDFIIRGEGEYAMLDLVKALRENGEPRGLLGLTYRSRGLIKRNPQRPPIKNLDMLPMPAYHLLPMEKYVFRKEKYATMITSRGCPFKCTFCSSSKICGKTWRGRTASKVADEVELLLSEYNVKSIEFLDDTFTLNKKRARELCNELIKRKIDVSWVCSSRVDTINSQLASRLRKAGCFVIYFGVESGSQRVLNLMKKGITVLQAEYAVKLAKEAGLKALTSFILGMPDETIEEAEKTIDFAIKLNPEYAQFTIATPYPGTELYDYAEKNDLLLTRDWLKYDTLTPVMKTKIGADKLAKLLIKAYFKFYVRLSYLIAQLRKKRLFVAKKASLALKEYLKVIG